MWNDSGDGSFLLLHSNMREAKSAGCTHRMWEVQRQFSLNEQAITQESAALTKLREEDPKRREIIDREERFYAFKHAAVECLTCCTGARANFPGVMSKEDEGSTSASRPSVMLGVSQILKSARYAIFLLEYNCWPVRKPNDMLTKLQKVALAGGGHASPRCCSVCKDTRFRRADWGSVCTTRFPPRYVYQCRPLARQ